MTAFDSIRAFANPGRWQLAPSEQNARRERYWPLALVVAAFLLASSWFYTHKTPLGDPPDEWAHLSYIAEIALKHQIIPDYRHSVILNSGAPNYLEHPPLYYTVEGLFGRVFHWDPQRNFERYRELSSIWVALGIFFWVLACGQFGFGRVRTIGVVSACFAVPMFTYLAGSVNNDDLCYLGVALFFYGFGLFNNRATCAPYVLALGILIVFLTKATGALFLTAFLAAWLISARKQVPEWLKDRNVRIAAVGVVAILVLYYLPTLIVYHTPFPRAGTTQVQAVPPDPTMTFPRFCGEFADTMVQRLPIIFAQVSWAPIPEKLNTWFYLMLLAPLAAWLIWRPFAKPGWRRDLGDAFLVALVVTIAVNLWLSWQAYRHLGVIPGVQPRYYNYTLPGLFLIGFLGDGPVRTARQFLFLAFVLIAVVLGSRIPFQSALEPGARHLSIIEGNPNKSVSLITLEVPVIQSNSGYIDVARMKGRTAFISGWAVDSDSKAAAREVVISLHGRLLGIVHPNHARPDVADALGSPSAGLSGFGATIQNLPPDVSACDLTIQAEQDDGSLAPIGQGACQKH